MSIKNKSDIVEAVGRHVLDKNGSEFLQLIYLIEEKNSLKMLWVFVLLNKKSQKSILEFMEYISGFDNLKLRVDHSRLHIEEE